MTGRTYYLTTLADWHRHAARFANSHFLYSAPATQQATPRLPRPRRLRAPIRRSSFSLRPTKVSTSRSRTNPDSSHSLILWRKSTSHPLCRLALEPYGIAPGATTFDAADRAVSRVHPLLRHRVF